MKQLGINPDADKLARDNRLGHWSCTDPMLGQSWLRNDGQVMLFATAKSHYKTDNWIFTVTRNMKQFDRFKPIGKDWQQPEQTILVSFKKLSLGARFKYVDANNVYVKIGHDLIARWDRNNIDTAWVGQGIFSFSDDGDTDIDVELME